MQKIGIISLFNLNNVNYGNRLQAYALNRYLRENFSQYYVESLYFSEWGEKIKTRKESAFHLISHKLRRLLEKSFGKEKRISSVKQRMERMNQFSANQMQLVPHAVSWRETFRFDYDILIVGSDIVWGQAKGEISRLYFLDFNSEREYRKIAYAASFGDATIPEENKQEIKRCLSSFDAISVRESSGVKIVKNLGISSAVHVADPTLLLTRVQWQEVEKQPDTDISDYIFVYLLGDGMSERKEIERISKESGLKIVTIPFASGTYNHADNDFDAIKIMDCSVEEWIWLIHHAQYVVTDSFHGTVFSTIFEKKFLVARREFQTDINERMYDYLRLIDEQDKMIALDSISNLQELSWDYAQIKHKMAEFIIYSKDYLRRIL